MKKDDDPDIENDLKINKFKLDVECEQHAGLYYSYAKQLADAKAEADSAKDRLSLTIADRDAFIRSNWDDEINGKLTEKSVASAVDKDEQVLHSKEDLGKAQKQVYIFDAAVRAFDHRKSMLDNLVTLLVKGFYAAPNGGRREGPQEQAESSVRNKLNKEKK